MTGWGGDDPPESSASALEAANAIRQFDHLRALVRARASVTPSLVRKLNALAVQGLVEQPGAFRTRDVVIGGSRHEPPPHDEVPGLVGEMCADIERADPGDPVATGAFALWRLNWIHPFVDGNGRTARALAYLVICRPARRVLPGEVALPERIRHERLKYQTCLEQADEACRRGRIDVSHMTGFLGRLVRAQLQGR